jgi:Fe-S-cluster containining protein
MKDWLEPSDELGNKERIYMLAPASLGHGGGDAPEIDFSFIFSYFWSKGQCTFLKEGLCEIHDSGFKPIQCRMMDCSVPKATPNNYDVARMWNTSEGEEALRIWDEELLKKELAA